MPVTGYVLASRRCWSYYLFFVNIRSMSKDKLYFWNKGLWLLMQALVLPMSAVYLSRVTAPTFPNELIKVLFELAGSILLLLWLIAQALLIMHRFPLRLAPALRLTGGYLLSFMIIWNMEGNPLFAAYASFFTTLLATTACGLIIYFQALRLNKFSAKNDCLLNQVPLCFFAKGVPDNQIFDGLTAVKVFSP